MERFIAKELDFVLTPCYLQHTSLTDRAVKWNLLSLSGGILIEVSSLKTLRDYLLISDFFSYVFYVLILDF